MKESFSQISDNGIYKKKSFQKYFVQMIIKKIDGP